MITYVWGRRNEHARMAVLDLVVFRAPFLPWVLLGLSLLLGQSATLDLIGIAVGHVYFYLKDVLGQVAEFRGWTRTDFLPTPRLLCVRSALEAQSARPRAHPPTAPQEAAAQGRGLAHCGRRAAGAVGLKRISSIIGLAPDT